ncbi:MAG: tetratricopeptide repeat protein [Candidatus Promineifilaceae bacterium]|jgi:tetratricopeptide (TPR) repeat protein
MVVLSNPYIAGNPVRGETYFVGRTDILRDVLALFRNPQANAIVLYGQRRIGKTSILLELEQQLAESGAYLPVYFDLHDKSDLSLSEILYRLAEQVSRHVDGIIVDRAHFDKEGSFFRNDFLPAAVCPTSKKLIFLFDEFDVLDRPYKGQVGATFLPYLRRWVAPICDVQFVLAMGRRPDELSTQTLNTFRQAQLRHVSLMDTSESLAIVRQSEQNHSLHWSDSGINRTFYWTQGHPYLTQLLCSEVWEMLYDDAPSQPPTATAEDVDLAVEGTLELGANAFQWIWNGLTPAEKIALSAMAGPGKDTMSRQLLHSKLRYRGSGNFRLELEMAPENLVERDLLRHSGNGYRFAIPLLQRWIKENQPFGRVRADLENLEPQARALFKDGKERFNKGDLDKAEMLFRRALAINPNHVQARLLLGRVHLLRGNPAEAVSVIESAYGSDPKAARPDLMTALLALADAQTDMDEQWRTLSRAARIEPDQPLVREKQSAVLRGWARRAEAERQYQDALTIYEQLGDGAAASAVRRKMFQQSVTDRLTGFLKFSAK